MLTKAFEGYANIRAIMRYKIGEDENEISILIALEHIKPLQISSRSEAGYAFDASTDEIIMNTRTEEEKDTPKIFLLARKGLNEGDSLISKNSSLLEINLKNLATFSKEQQNQLIDERMKELKKKLSALFEKGIYCLQKDTEYYMCIDWTENPKYIIEWMNHFSKLLGVVYELDESYFKPQNNIII